MKELFEKIPIPMSGLMLGLFSMAKLSISLNIEVIYFIMLALGMTTWLLLVGKIVFAFPSCIEGLKNPIVASVAPTFTMGSMVFFSLFAKQYMIANILWFAALALQIVLIIYFIKQFILSKSISMQHVFPSWFILFVGLGAAPVSLGNIHPTISHSIISVVIGTYVIVLPMVLIRLKKFPLPDAAKPLIAILCAPSSLIFVGYMTSVTTKYESFVFIFFILSQTFYVIVLSQMPKLLALPFFPSYAALTFPLVISATAMQKMAIYTQSNLLQSISYIEFVIGALIVLYVYIRYMRFLSKAIQPSVATS